MGSSKTSGFSWIPSCTPAAPETQRGRATSPRYCTKRMGPSEDTSTVRLRGTTEGVSRPTWFAEGSAEGFLAGFVARNLA
jgi:hypothetical protein